MNGETLVKVLEVIRDEILPLTESEAAKGGGTVGAAILRADTLTSVMVGSDCVTDGPLGHGEMDALSRFFKLPVRPDPAELIFVATHEPCPVCAAAIASSGFKQLWVLYGADDPQHPAGAAHRAMYRDLFGVYGPREDNPYFKLVLLRPEIEADSSGESAEILAEIERQYAAIHQKAQERAEAQQAQA